MPPGLMRHRGIALQESLADRGGDHGVLSFRHVGQGVAHPMNPAALPSGAEHASDRQAQAVMSIRDHQLDTLRPRLTKPFRKADQPFDRLRRFGLRGADAETDDLAPALGINGDGDYRGNRDDAAAVADLQVSGVEPQIPPFAVDQPVEERVDPFINVPGLRRGRLVWGVGCQA